MRTGEWEARKRPRAGDMDYGRVAGAGAGGWTG
jgi:hypothetical protein